MTGADGCAEDLVLPVGVGIAKLRGVKALNAVHKVPVFRSVQCIILLGDSRDGHVAVVGYARCAALLTLLGGDDDHTVRSAATVDGCSRGILQHGEGLDVVRVDHSQDVRHTCGGVAVDGQTVDDIERVVGGVQ